MQNSTADARGRCAEPSVDDIQDHFTLGHILGASMVATYVDATLTPTLSLWERVGVRVPQ